MHDRDAAAATLAPATKLRWFVRMPVALLKDSSVSHDAKTLAGLLLWYDGPTGCHPRIDPTLMRDLACSKHTVFRLLEELERYGFFTRERRGRTNLYRLHVLYDEPTKLTRLVIENDPAKRPEQRKALRRKGRTGETNPQPSPPVENPPAAVPIGRTRETNKGRTRETLSRKKGRTRATCIEQEPSYINNQQQQEAAAGEKKRREIATVLETAGFYRDDSLLWSIDLVTYDVPVIAAAVGIMTKRKLYREGRLRNPFDYLCSIVRALAAKATPRTEEPTDLDATFAPPVNLAPTLEALRAGVKSGVA